MVRFPPHTKDLWVPVNQIFMKIYRNISDRLNLEKLEFENAAEELNAQKLKEYAEYKKEETAEEIEKPERRTKKKMS